MKAGIDYTGVTAFFFCHDGAGKFLLHKRSQNCRDEQGHWDSGGGKVEFGEDLREAVLRELKEEYGCDGEIEIQLPAVSRSRVHDGVPTHWICIGFIIKIDPTEAKNNEPTAIDEIGWFKLDEFPEPLHSCVPLDLAENPEIFAKYR
jgi:ADP-ribose pyrophosphatase YjhB (NUDIX family)